MLRSLWRSPGWCKNTFNVVFDIFHRYKLKRTNNKLLWQAAGNKVSAHTVTGCFFAELCVMGRDSSGSWVWRLSYAWMIYRSSGVPLKMDRNMDWVENVLCRFFFFIISTALLFVWYGFKSTNKSLHGVSVCSRQTMSLCCFLLALTFWPFDFLNSQHQNPAEDRFSLPQILTCTFKITV